MSADEVQAVIAEADLNGDGKLDYAEFCLLLNSTSEECIQVNRQKVSQAEPEQSRSPKSHVTRRSSVVRRERRREEIRMQLYSPEPTISEKLEVGMNGGVVATPSSDAAQTQPEPQSATMSSVKAESTEVGTTVRCKDGGVEDNGAHEDDVPMESLRPEQETENKDTVRQTDHLDKDSQSNRDTAQGNGEASHDSKIQGPSSDETSIQEGNELQEDTAPSEEAGAQKSHSNWEKESHSKAAPSGVQDTAPSDEHDVQESRSNGETNGVQESHSNAGVQESHGKDAGTEPSGVTGVQELQEKERREDPISSDKEAEVKAGKETDMERETYRGSDEPPPKVAPCSVVTSPPKMPSNIEVHTYVCMYVRNY